MLNSLRKIRFAFPRQKRVIRVLKAICCVVPAVLAAQTIEAQPVPSLDWMAAAEKVVRLGPVQFSFLSTPTIALLEQLDCKIPQHAFSKEPNNLITGQFLKRGQIDVALLCERGQTTTLLLLPNMGKGKPMPLAVSSVEGYLQVLGPDEIGFSWGIGKVPLKKFMQASKEAGCKWRSDYPPNGIDVAFIEKASTVWYLSHGGWQGCQGSD